MPSLVGKMPRVYLEYEGGLMVEVRLTQMNTHLDHGRMGITEIQLTGDIFDFDIIKAGRGTVKPVAMRTGEVVNLGGIPPEVTLRCGTCSYFDAGSTHTCSE